MKIIVPVAVVLALIGGNAIADTTSPSATQAAPNGGTQDTSRSNAVPTISSQPSGQMKKSGGMSSAAATGSQAAPNGGSQDTSRSNAVPAIS